MLMRVIINPKRIPDHKEKLYLRRLFRVSLSGKCFKGNYGKRKIAASQTYVRKNREATERITTENGVLLRINRSIQVEGAFGVLLASGANRPKTSGNFSQFQSEK